MERSLWRNFDFPLLLISLCLAAYGVAIIYSATQNTPAISEAFFNTPVGRQIVFIVAGVIGLITITLLDYRLLGNIYLFLYVATIGGLAFVLIQGQQIYGARRWIDLGLFPVQPAEIAKLLLTLVLGRYLADHLGEIKRLKVFVISLGLVLLPAAMTFLQPDLGTVIIFGAMWLGMVFMAGARLKHLGVLLLMLVLSIPFVYVVLLKEYMRQRLHLFLNPASDPLGAGYNILQSEISVGSGGLWGKGFLNGTQTQLHFLRIQRTDFVFSVIGEELGFVGGMVLFGLFILLLMRGIRVAMLARDDYGRLVAVGIVVWVLFQVFINVGVNVRLLPVTGIPLPFISYGGSSLITLFIAVGILEAIVARHKRLEF